MRIPQSWDDKTLLQDEPFLSNFYARSIQGSTRNEGKRMNNEVGNEIKQQNGGIKVVQTWLELAFGTSDDSVNRPKVDHETLLIFVEFYWNLFQSEDLARRFVQKHRKDKRYVYVDHLGRGLGPKLSATKHKLRKCRRKMKGNKIIRPETEDDPMPDACLPNDMTVFERPPNPTSSVVERVKDRSPTHPPVPLVMLPENDEVSMDWLANSQTHGDLEDSDPDDAELKLDYMTLVDAIVYYPKPPLPFNPPIWAQSRQEVCESFDWFRSYQSGVYHTNNIVKGYLLSAFSARRDKFEHNGRLIISHGPDNVLGSGGKAESLHFSNGQTTNQLADDQLAQDKSVRALLNNYRNNCPLVLLIDDKYILFPYDLGSRDITYAALGFYTIVSAWAEYQPANNERGRVVRYKFAFQWCDDQGEPWWLQTTDKSGPTIIDRLYMDSPTVNTSAINGQQTRPVKVKEYSLVNSRIPQNRPSFLCGCCKERSPRVYAQGIVCLNSDCPSFWTMKNGQPLPENLDYHPKFLDLSGPTVLLPKGYNIFSSIMPVTSSENGITTTYAFTRGWHCKVCGRLSCRYKWEHWECMTCKTTYHVPGKIRAAKDFWHQSLPTQFWDHRITASSGIKKYPIQSFTHERGSGQYQTFVLPFGRGLIHHIQAGSPLAKIEADIIFKEYQEQASTGELPFRRWPLRSHKCRGSLLTNYFSQNTGEPYKYVGGAENTIPFNKAPSAVVRARALIQKRVNQALHKTAYFNEILSAAYMERQKMAFHSDNEVGLGPLIAGLSLGSPALMHFRLLAKHDQEREQRNVLLTFILRHGDVLVMDGAEVQEYYEHTVVPTNFRIAATARLITPDHA